MGSPTRFGNMAAPLKYFLRRDIGSEWITGAHIERQAGRCVHFNVERCMAARKPRLLSDGIAADPSRHDLIVGVSPTASKKLCPQPRQAVLPTAPATSPGTGMTDELAR